jgi:hypothetical protein
VLGKLANISARFLSISSADGAGPYLARMPRMEREGSFLDAGSGASPQNLIDGLAHKFVRRYALGLSQGNQLCFLTRFQRQSDGHLSSMSSFAHHFTKSRAHDAVQLFGP